MIRAAAILALAWGLVLQLTGQTAAQGAARITSPEDGAYLMGPVRFTIAFEPLSIVAQVRQVRWFANGRHVCTAAVPPFSCEWDAGETVSEHVIRAVVSLAGDGQLVANARTRGVQFAQSVDVDVVQVTAVVTDGNGRFVTGLKASDFKV